MPSEEKQKINVWIPRSLWKQIESLGHDSPTKATIAAFEALVLQEALGSNQEALGSNQEEVRKLQEEIRRYQEKLKNLGARPDPVTFAQLQARYEGLQEIIREKEKSIERLENDLKKAGQREEDLKQLHNNYFLQVQTLINQKAIGSPKEAIRKKQEVSGSNQEDNRKSQGAQKESRYREKEEKLFDVDLEESPAIKESPDSEPEKGHIEKICKYCGKPFYTDNIQKEYCSKDHKDTAYNEKRKKERENRKKENNIEE